MLKKLKFKFNKTVQRLLRQGGGGLDKRRVRHWRRVDLQEVQVLDRGYIIYTIEWTLNKQVQKKLTSTNGPLIAFTQTNVGGTHLGTWKEQLSANTDTPMSYMKPFDEKRHFIIYSLGNKVDFMLCFFNLRNIESDTAHLRLTSCLYLISRGSCDEKDKQSTVIYHGFYAKSLYFRYWIFKFHYI